MQQNALKNLHKLVKGKILFNVPLSRYTSLRVGGPAEIMIYPLNIMELQKVINFSHTYKVPYFILGRGTNLLIKDGGVRGIVIKLSRSFKKIKIVETLRNHTRLLVESGVSLRRLLNFSAEKGLSGLEFLSGIPGSTGGALWMNSGAYGRQMQDVTESLTLMTPKAEVVEKKRDQ
ncbi:MAG: FAD-binding protein, partial [Deltaproteobacteria bacterium]|nr:FAD-binding protein [Deltaproteobacteria bacterium]